MVDRNLTTFRQYSEFTTREGMSLYVPPSDVFTMSSIPRAVDPFSESITQQFPLGTELKYGDRVFKYAKMGAVAGVAGNLYQSVVPLAGHINEVIGTHAIGELTITFTPNTVTTDDLAANELADGYININDDTGEAQLLRIKSHPAIVGGVAGVLTLVDPVHIAIGANATGTVLHNKYRGTIIHTSVPTAPITGVAVIPVTAAYYHWQQVKGWCSVLIDGTVVIAQMVMPSNTTDGAVEAFGVAEAAPPTIITPMCGTVVAVNATTEYGVIDLYIP